MQHVYSLPVSVKRIKQRQVRFFTRRMAGVLVILAVIANVAGFGLNLPGGIVGATGNHGTGAVCPQGDVKFNVGSGYEYTDHSATITIIDGVDNDDLDDDNDGKNKVTWAAANGYSIVSVCVKIGGPNGGTLKSPNANDGQAGPYDYDISHVVITTESTDDTDTVPNPPLGQSCGLDVGLIIDDSGSVNSSEMTQMKSALTTFVNAFAGTPSEFSVTTFNTNSSVVQTFSDDLGLVTSKINNNVPNSGNGNTNWDSGLARSFDTFGLDHKHRPAKQDVIVIATDGSPNRWGYPTTTATFNWAGGLEHAVTRANVIKNSGTRIIAIGIGGDPTDPDFPNVDYKFKAISGPNMAPPAGVDVTTDVIKTDFNQLGSAMAELASELCGGKILVQKQFDTNGDGQADLDGSQAHALLSGWTFNVNGSPSNPANQTTTNTGALEFSVANGSYSLTETNGKPNVELVDVTCLNGDEEVGKFNTETQTVTGLFMDTDQTITCRFLNASTIGSLTIQKIVDSGDISPDAFSFTISPDPNQVSPVQTTNGEYTFTNLPLGTYTVTEADMAGYHQESTTCTNVAVTADDGVDNSDAELIDIPGGHGDEDGTILSLHQVQDQDDEDGAVAARCVFHNAHNEVPPTPVTTIHLDKTGPATVVDNGQIAYTLDWSVSGNTAATNAVITDPIPANTTFVSASNGGTLASGVVTWNLGTKNPGDNGTVSVVVSANNGLANGTVITNSGVFDTDQTEPANDSATTTVQITPATSISLDKSGPATVAVAGQITYTLAWSVSGNTAATNAVVTDPIPTNTTFVSADSGGTFSAGVVTWNLGTKAVGSNGTVFVTVSVNSGLANGTVITNAGSFDTDQTGPANDSVNTTVQVTTPVVTQSVQPTLSITKSNNLTTFTAPGGQVTYTVVVTNSANATVNANNVVLMDVLPSGFTYVVGGGTTKNFNLGNIAPGASVTTSYVAVISANHVAGTFVNTATAKGDNTNTVSAVSAVEVRVPVVLSAEAAPQLKVEKTAGTSVVNPGGNVTYMITVKNVGNAPALDVVLTDTLPAGFTFHTGGGNVKQWELGTIEEGQTKTIRYKTDVSNEAAIGTSKNTAVVTSSNAGKSVVQAPVELKPAGRVLGLAVTGAGPKDYTFIAFGLLLMTAGFLLQGRFRRLNGPPLEPEVNKNRVV